MNEQAAPTEQPTTATPDEHVKVCLSNHAPVRIRPSQWPIILERVVPLWLARSNGQDVSALDSAKGSIAYPHSWESEMDDIRAAEMDDTETNAVEPAPSVPGSMNVIVRRHQDGRTLMYGVTGQGDQSLPLGGELLPPDLATPQVDAGRIVQNLLVAAKGTRMEPYERVIAMFASALKRKYPVSDELCCESPDGGRGWVDLREWKELVGGTENLTTFVQTGPDLDCDPATWKPVVYATQGLAVSRNVHDERHLVLAQYRHVPEGAVYDIFAPCYAVIVPSLDGVPGALSRLGKAMCLSMHLVQSCLDGLPTEDLT